MSTPETTTPTVEDRARVTLGISSDPILRLVERAIRARHPGGGTLVDLGCGTGNLWRFVGDRFARYVDRYGPARIASRSFTYGLSHWPVEVIWSLPADYDELTRLEKAIGYDFLIIHEKHPIRLYLVGNPRYLRINKDDKGAEFLIWRRLY